MAGNRGKWTDRIEAAYQAAAAAHAEYEAYFASVQIDGYDHSSRLYELEQEYEAACDRYHELWVEENYPESTAEAEASLETWDRELGPDPDAEVQAEVGAYADYEAANQIDDMHKAIAEAEAAATEAEAEPPDLDLEI